jgi:hypothetical protein
VLGREEVDAGIREQIREEERGERRRALKGEFPTKNPISGRKLLINRVVRGA